MQIQIHLLLEGLDELVGFRKHIPRINQNDRNLRSSTGHHMEHHSRLCSKTGAHDQLIPKFIHSPSDSLLSTSIVQMTTGRIDLGH